MRPRIVDVLKAFAEQFPGATVAPNVVKAASAEVATANRERMAARAVRELNPGNRQQDPEDGVRMLTETAKKVQEMREILQTIPREQWRGVFEVLVQTPDEDEEPGAAEPMAEADLTKSVGKRATPGTFTALVADHVCQWNDPAGFTNSLESDEQPTEIFSKERMAEEAAERIAKQDGDVHPFHPSPAKQPARRMRITHIGKD